MKRSLLRTTGFILLLCIPLISTAMAQGRPRTRAFADQVEGGSLSVTNTDTTAAYELKHVSFSVAATITNTFTISHLVRYKLPDLKVSAVTTNTFLSSGDPDYIETNTQWYAQGYATFTNSYTVAVTTNDTDAQFYDTDDFPKGWSWEWNDVQVFTFSDTNDINLIRVYDVYPRP